MYFFGKFYKSGFYGVGIVDSYDDDEFVDVVMEVGKIDYYGEGDYEDDDYGEGLSG